MKKLLILGLLGAVALVAVGKTTSAWSYLSTAVCQVGAEAKNQVPTKFELERIRNEIAGLDGDITQMVRPIAEYKSVIEKMRKDIARSQTNIDKQKKTLLEVVTELQENPKQITINDKVYTLAQIRGQVVRDTERLKQLEKHVKVQQQVLEAKELSLKATQEQLAKVISKKREYDVRLAQLEADEETLQLASVGSDVKIDNTRASLIEDALNAVEQKQDVTRKVNELRTGELANINLEERNRTPADLSTIRSYLEGTEKTADNK